MSQYCLGCSNQRGRGIPENDFGANIQICEEIGSVVGKPMII
jgi:hypothetical protein